jgi:hypothetical protein
MQHERLAASRTRDHLGGPGENVAVTSRNRIMTKRAWWMEKSLGTVNARGYAALLPFVTATVVLAGSALFGAH